MKTQYRVLIVLLIAAGSFGVGYWAHHGGDGKKTAAKRAILYYVDPMHPSYTSDKPGIAPDCGMQLEPVYSDGGVQGGANLQKTMPPGTVRIAAEKQQLIGVKTATVQEAPWSHTLRVLGRVTPDETRLYRINAAVACLIKEVLPVTTGSQVKKDDLLAAIYSTEYRASMLAYVNLLKSMKPSAPAPKAEPSAAQRSMAKGQEAMPKEAEMARTMSRTDTGAPVDSAVDYYRKILVNYGMSERQMDEMEHTRTFNDDIEIRAPANGFVLLRNASPGQRVERGAELFQIADLSRVWILADVFENEAAYFRPGMRVKMELPYQKKTLSAAVSSVLPLFDSTTRTLKVRLLAENADFAMRPDMYVNVELSASGPPAIIVPVDAVLDSGLKKTVFVDRGEGYFEPRQVQTGRLLGERVEIVRGLLPGEKIVVSGNFLIDSESRLQAAAGITGKIGRDPVCGMAIDEDRARAEGNLREYKGKSYFFCSPQCRDDFGKDPGRYSNASPEKKVASPTPHGAAPAAEAPARGSSPARSGAPAMDKMPMNASGGEHAHD